MLRKFIFLLSIMFVSIGLCSCSSNVINETSDDITSDSNNDASDDGNYNDNTDVKQWNSVSDQKVQL